MSNFLSFLFVIDLTFFFYFLIYLFHQARYIFGGDSAEFSLTGNTFSIPHPPGYPLYTLIGNIITRIVPFFTPSWRLALLSSIPTIITGYLIYKILNQLVKHQFIAIVSSFFYLMLLPIWLYGVVPEVFALNNLLIVAITYSVIKLNESKNEIYINLIFLLLGFSLCNHHIFILFIPGWYFLINKETRLLFVKNKIKNILFSIIGLSFYLYPPTASLFNPPLDWENAKTLDGFIRLITRASYGTFKAYSEASPHFVTQLLSFFSVFFYILSDFRILGVMFILIGLFYFKKINRLFLRFVLISAIVELFYFFYANYILISDFNIAGFERFLTFLYLVLIFPFAFGIYYIFNLFRNIQAKFITNEILKRIINASFYTFIIVFLLIVTIKNLLIVRNIPNMKDFQYFGESILKTAPKKSLIILEHDTYIFPALYSFYLKGQKVDVKLILGSLLFRDYYRERVKKQYPDLFIWKKMEKSVKKNMEIFLYNNNERYIILFNEPPQVGYWLPYGLLWKYYPTAEAARNDTLEVITYNQEFWKNYRIPELTNGKKDISYLSNLQKTILKAYLSFGKLLIYNKRIKEADRVLQTIYHTYQTHFYDPELIKLYTQLRDCLRSTYYFNQMKESDFLDKSEDLKILIQYFGVCRITPANPEKYIKKYQEFKQREDVSLDKL